MTSIDTDRPAATDQESADLPNPARLDALLGQFVGDMGAAIHAITVVIGDKLGLYRALAARPVTSAELAAATGTAERYVREWLRGQAAGGYVDYDAHHDTYHLSPEQTMLFADSDSPAFVAGAFWITTALARDEAPLLAAFRSGDGIAWSAHDTDLFAGIDRFFRPGYAANLVDQWLPALPDVVDRLTAGARVADVGCGHGASTLLMARAFPQSAFVGSDYHEGSIAAATRAADARSDVTNCRFEVATADTFSGAGLDLVTTFDCLHDLGDPVAAARHVRRALADDGCWLVVEPAAGDTVSDNLNPIGRIYYNASTLMCVPNALSQSGALALGAQAGPAAIERVCREAGFTRFRQAAATPFNLVYDVRP